MMKNRNTNVPSNTRRVRTAMVGLLVALVAGTASAGGDLIVGATVTRMYVRDDVGSTDYVMILDTTSGTGYCAGSPSNTQIKFPKSGDTATDEGMRSIALAAYLSGKPVRIYDSGSSLNCQDADYIRIGN